MYRAEFKSVGNPDHGQYVGEDILSPTETHSSATIEGLQDALRVYIKEYGLGGGNLPQICVFEVKGKKVVKVGALSYNTKFWPIGHEYAR